METDQLYLFREKRFLPLFITQFGSCLGDNLLKSALIIFVTYVLAGQRGYDAGQMILLANAILIFPFLLFSGIGGQLADKYEKKHVIVVVKFVEMFFAFLGIYGFHHENIFIMYTALFLMGSHAAFFGPVKFSILPETLKKEELLSANGYIEAGTFVGILIGTLLGGLYNFYPSIVISIMIFVVVGSFIAALFIPKIGNSQPSMKLDYNIFRESTEIVKNAASKRQVFLSILGISWFWFIGAAFLSEIPILSKEIFCTNEHVANLFLAIFSIGVGVGSFWCNKIYENEITSKYVPISALILSVFVVDLYFACGNLAPKHCSGELLGLFDFLSYVNNVRVMFDLFFISAISGLYAVPLYATMQYFSAPSHRSRVIAANNIMNALFMIGSSLLLSLLFFFKLSVPTVILILGIMNAIVALKIYKIVPDAGIIPKPLARTVLKFIFDKLYRVEVKGIEHLKNSGDRAVIIANHISYLDPPIMAVYLSHQIVFAVDAVFAQKWWMKIVLRIGNSYPVDRNNPMAMKSLISEIKKGKKVLIYPEGRLTTTGGLMKVYDGPGMLADKAGADIIPVRIEGMEYTWFSKLLNIPRRRIFPKVTLTIMPPVDIKVPEDISTRDKRKYFSTKIYDIMCQMVVKTSDTNQTLFQSVLDSAKVCGYRKKIVQDIGLNDISYRTLIARSFVLGNYISNSTIQGEYVGIMLPNAAATVATFFAMQATGRVPAMLNYTSGAKNIISACNTLKVKTIYSSKAFIEKANLQDVDETLSTKFNVIYLEDIKAEISIFEKLKYVALSFLPNIYYNHFLWNDVDPDSPAVALLTSGTEGVPKAVVLSHSNIQSNQAQATSRFDFNSSNIAFNALPLFHCFGLTGMFLMMKAGIKTFLYPSPLHYREIPEIIYDLGASIVFSTDTFLNGYAKFADQYDFYAVRYIIAGAEKLKPETRKLWSDKYGVRILEGYGVTEAAPVISANSLMHEKQGTVGRFMPDIEYKIEPVEGLSEGGVLYIKGPNVMLGYVRADKPGIVQPVEDGWYNTGDIVTVDDEGYITILGRQKRFAKIGGEMVPLSAIEEVALEVDKSAAVAAMHIPDPRKGEQILIFSDSKKIDRDSMKAIIQEMGYSELYLPKYFVYLAEIPVLATGKTDYRKLLEMSEEYIKSQQ